MARIKNHKALITLLVIWLFVLSFSVFFAPDMKPVKRVRVQNRAIVISQGNPEINNTHIGTKNNSANIQNKDMESFNKELGVNNHDVNIDKNGKVNYNNIGSSHNSSSRVKFNSTDINGRDLGFNHNSKYSRDMEKYDYKKIDWGTWKSRFVNRILDDSLYIRSLDAYGIGTWFYYSFVVTNTGEIHDVTVFSLYLTESDKLQIRALIRSYEKSPITVFPENTKRKKAKIKAVMLLGDSEQKASSSNFLDTERVKIKK